MSTASAPICAPMFAVGDRVVKRGEDSVFGGTIVCVFTKLNGRTVRYVVESAGGILHITSAKQLSHVY